MSNLQNGLNKFIQRCECCSHCSHAHDDDAGVGIVFHDAGVGIVFHAGVDVLDGDDVVVVVRVLDGDDGDGGVLWKW